MATNKDTENSTPSAQTPADNDIAKLTEVTEQDLAEAIIDEYGAKYSKDGKRLLKGPRYASLYNIKKGTEIIGNYAFSRCKRLTSITIPPSVTAIGDKAFSQCYSLTTINIPPSVTAIGHSAFSDCESLTSINIPPSVTAIGDSAFRWCSSLTSITIPPSVTTIGNSAFSGCESLTSITIPPSVTTIGDHAFYSCIVLWEYLYVSPMLSFGFCIFFVNEQSLDIGQNLTFRLMDKIQAPKNSWYYTFLLLGSWYSCLLRGNFICAGVSPG